ncbi:MAG: F0F1 ATP synthase subunit delta [Candidatus Omnitrophica bacterium]|nr:F0F1 ATP synthase subunit delta [Candidatus Omnitrophota bacterium]
MLIVSLIVLLVIIFLVMVFMFRKIMTQNVTLATSHLEDLNREYSEKEKEVNRKLEEVQLKSQEILARAQSESEKLRDDALKEIESEKERILQAARTHSEEMIKQAERSRQALIQEIEERIAKEAVNKACELIQTTLPEQFKREVHAHWIEELITNGFNQLERLRLPEDVEEIKITSAFALDDRQRKIMVKKLSEALKRNITLKEEIEAKIVAGFIISIGSLVLDGSLKNKIQEQAKGIK